MLTPDVISALLPVLRAQLKVPSLELHAKPGWNRIAIRQDLVAALPEIDDSERELLLRLDYVPDPPGVSVSISHTPSVGGFVLARSPGESIGLDLEDLARVHVKAVARIAKPEELSQAPSAAMVWCAKEASFKALRGRPKVLSQLTVGKWQSVLKQKNLSLWSCEVREDSLPNAVCRGLTVELSSTGLAILMAPR